MPRPWTRRTARSLACSGGRGPIPALGWPRWRETAASELLGAAAARLGRPCQQLRRLGRPEHEVVTAAQGAALLVAAREGAAAGPKSLGKTARFVVDHAACPVLLIWPGPVPEGPPPRPPKPPHSGPGRPQPLE